MQAVVSGFVYALDIADKFIRSGSCGHALVVGAEVFSRILDWNDRGTCVLFGDGAGAVVLAAVGQARHSCAACCMPTARTPAFCPRRDRVSGGKVTGDPFLHMDGGAYSNSRCACWTRWRAKSLA